MQRLEVSGAVRLIYRSLGVKGLILPFFLPVPVTARSKAYVYGRSPAGTVGSNPTGGMDVFLLCVLCVCFQVEVSVTSWPLVQGSPTDCGASLCVTSKPHE